MEGEVRGYIAIPIHANTCATGMHVMCVVYACVCVLCNSTCTCCWSMHEEFSSLCDMIVHSSLLI